MSKECLNSPIQLCNTHLCSINVSLLKVSTGLETSSTVPLQLKFDWVPENIDFPLKRWCRWKVIISDTNATLNWIEGKLCLRHPKLLTWILIGLGVEQNCRIKKWRKLEKEMSVSSHGLLFMEQGMERFGYFQVCL